MSAGMLGMTLTTRTPLPSRSSMKAVSIPAAMETTSACGAIASRQFGKDLRHVLRLDGEEDQVGVPHRLPVVGRHPDAVSPDQLRPPRFVLVRHGQSRRLQQAAGEHPLHEGAPHLSSADHTDLFSLQHRFLQ